MTTEAITATGGTAKRQLSSLEELTCTADDLAVRLGGACSQAEALLETLVGNTGGEPEPAGPEPVDEPPGLSTPLLIRLLRTLAVFDIRLARLQRALSTASTAIGAPVQGR